MITKEKLQELTRKMVHHDTVNDIAVVVITVRDLQDLIMAASAYQEISCKEMNDLLDEGKR
jgi:hypothetical protein